MKEINKLKFIKKLKENKGITIVELFLSVTLILIIVTLATMSFFNATNASDITINTATSIRDARTALYRITKDMREISTIEEADMDEVIFYSNIDSDDSFERIHYYLEVDTEDGSFNFLRGVEGADGKVLVNRIISDDIFSYITDFGEDTLDVPVDALELDSIKNININLLIDQESPTETPRTMELGTSVTLRNRI